jgi:hypothetical protein
MTATTFSPKDPVEIFPYGFDFASNLNDGEVVVSASASISVIYGTDETPETMLSSGSIIIDGSEVSHKVIGGLAGCTYLFSVTATTSGGNVIVESAPIKVI